MSLPDRRLIERACICGHSNEGARWLDTTSSHSTRRRNPQQRFITCNISYYDAGRLRHSFAETVTAVRRNIFICFKIFWVDRWSPECSVFLFVFTSHVENLHSQKFVRTTQTILTILQVNTRAHETFMEVQ